MEPIQQITGRLPAWTGGVSEGETDKLVRNSPQKQYNLIFLNAFITSFCTGSSRNVKGDYRVTVSCTIAIGQLSHMREL